MKTRQLDYRSRMLKVARQLLERFKECEADEQSNHVDFSRKWHKLSVDVSNFLQSCHDAEGLMP